MQETEQLISLYHTAIIVFLILTIVFALISVLIFFQFRIKDVYDFKTGRGQKRTIRQMEEENAKTGKLRQEYASANTSSDLYRTPSGEIPPVIYPKTEQMNTGTEPTEQTYMPSRPAHMPDSRTSLDGRDQTEALDNLAEGSEETTLLRENEGSEETTLLGGNSEPAYSSESETVVLNQDMLAAAMAKSVGRFEIVKESMWIHTDERI